MRKAYYELSEAKRTALEEQVSRLFGANSADFRIMHPFTTPAGYRHIDTIVVEKEDETVYVSEGVSAKRFRDHPFTEAFVKTKGIPEKIGKICDKRDFL